MTMRVKLISAGIVVAGAITYLAVAGMKSGWGVYYVDVDKYLADSQYHSQRVRVHGKVTEDGFTSSAATLTAKFKIAGQSGGAIPVSYRGPIPDMFQCGRDVVVEGKQGADGVFHADVLMTKCASKYEAKAKERDAAAAAPKAQAEKGS